MKRFRTSQLQKRRERKRGNIGMILPNKVQNKCIPKQRFLDTVGKTFYHKPMAIENNQKARQQNGERCVWCNTRCRSMQATDTQLSMRRQPKPCHWQCTRTYCTWALATKRFLQLCISRLASRKKQLARGLVAEFVKLFIQNNSEKACTESVYRLTPYCCFFPVLPKHKIRLRV